MKALILVGSYPPKFCGIGDYSKRLVESITALGLEIEVLSDINWGIGNYRSIVNLINKSAPDIIHIQYPSIGFGSSLIPQLLCLKFKTFVTIHEASQSHLLRKISLLPFSFARKLIFTNIFEQRSFLKMYPWVKKSKTEIIPIGSNIAQDKMTILEKRNVNTILCFGQIRPKKGIEDVIGFAKIVKAQELNYKIIIMGQTISKFINYYNTLKELSHDLPVEWIVDRNEDEVNKVLSANLVAYLPFPDGVSERRGSLLAALTNNMLVFTKFGEQTTNELKKVVIEADSPEKLVSFVKTHEVSELFNERIELIEEYMFRISWPNIAEMHMKLYQSV